MQRPRVLVVTGTYPAETVALSGVSEQEGPCQQQVKLNAHVWLCPSVTFPQWPADGGVVFLAFTNQSA